jgi:release factor glutamine methyltransferase
MTIQEGEKDLLQILIPIYGEREAAAIGDRLMEHLLNWKKIDRIINKNTLLSPDQQSSLQKCKIELSKLKPLQYVIGEAWFMGMKFYVDENVLIPRPETEELVEWLLQDLKDQKYDGISVLDVGTGSGCISIALKKRLERVNIISCDISSGAIAVAMRNADAQQVSINFVEMDFLDRQSWYKLPAIDIIISNPPYITVSEFDSLDKNVSQFEPHQALFVPDRNPLIFYAAIAQFANEKLNKGGKIYVEINEKKASDVKELLSRSGFPNAENRKDLQGNDRLIKATSLL